MSQREKVIRRSAELFAEFGVKAIRMDDIAHDLAMSKRTIYELFADKQELLYHAIRYRQRTEDADIASRVNVEQEGVPALFEMMRIKLNNGNVRQRIMANLKKFYPEVYERIASESRAEGLERLRNMIMYLINKGLVSPVINVDLSVAMFYYTSIGLFAHAGRLVLPDGITEQHAMMYTIINFFRGISTMEGIKQIDEYIAANSYKIE